MSRKISHRRCKPPWKMMTKQSLFSLVNIMYSFFNTQRVQWMFGSFPSSEPNKSWSTPQSVLPHLYSDSLIKSLLGGETKNKHIFSLPSTCHLPRGWRFSRALAYFACSTIWYCMFSFTKVTLLFSLSFCFVFIQILSWNSSQERIKSSWNGSSGGHT